MSIDQPAVLGTYQAKPHDVFAMKWGPTWAQMKKVARQLGEYGVCYRFDGDRPFDDLADEGLPGLYLYDDRWDHWQYNVRIGDRIVIYPTGSLRVLSAQAFRAEFDGPSEEHEL